MNTELCLQPAEQQSRPPTGEAPKYQPTSLVMVWYLIDHGGTRKCFCAVGGDQADCDALLANSDVETVGQDVSEQEAVDAVNAWPDRKQFANGDEFRRDCETDQGENQ